MFIHMTRDLQLAQQLDFQFSYFTSQNHTTDTDDYSFYKVKWI